MNWKKFFFAFIAAFVFLFVFGFLWYATLMHDAHREVPTLLRPEADLKSYFGWLALGQRDNCRNSAGSPAGNCSDRDAPWLLCRPTGSRKTDCLRKLRRHH